MEERAMKTKGKLAISSISFIYSMLILFTGCGRQGPADRSQASGAESLVKFNKTGYPVVDEPVILRFLYVKGASIQDLNSNKMFQEMEKLTNIHIDWQNASGADWTEQRSLLLASGDLPDVFFGSNSLRDVDIMTNLDMFVPLEDYIDDFCVNLQKAYREVPQIRKMITAPDGHIYTLSRKLPLRPHATDEYYINVAWLDKLGLKMPATTDELYQVLKAFKEYDVNGNGDPNDEIPWSGNGGKSNLSDLLRFMCPFGLTDSGGGEYLALDPRNNNDVVFIPADLRYKEFINWCRRLYSEGLLDPEYFTQDSSMYVAKVRNSEAALVGFGVSWEYNSHTFPHNGQYGILPPLTGPFGDCYIRGNDDRIIYGRNEFTITQNCKYPEVAMRWADTFATDDNSMQAYWGPFGEALEKSADGIINFLPPPVGKNGDNWYWELGPRDHGPKFVSAATEAKINLDPKSGDGLKMASDKINGPFVPGYYPLVNYTPDQMNEISLLTADIYKYCLEMAAKWITSGGIDREWDGYIAQLNQMKLPRLMEIYSESLAIYNK
jgi:putative aldouronate transport system substrate-binding protein